MHYRFILSAIISDEIKRHDNDAKPFVIPVTAAITTTSTAGPTSCFSLLIHQLSNQSSSMMSDFFTQTTRQAAHPLRPRFSLPFSITVDQKKKIIWISRLLFIFNVPFHTSFPSLQLISLELNHLSCVSSTGSICTLSVQSSR